MRDSDERKDSTDSTDSDELDDETLERLARLARARPAYLAWVFDRYERLRELPAGGLAEQLGVSPRDFLRLGVCLRPRGEWFEADVTRTAGAFGIDRFRLADVVRFVDAATAMSASEGSTPEA